MNDESCRYIIIVSDPYRGPVYGPFESLEDAIGWAEIFFLGTTWTAQPLTRPGDEPGGSPNLVRDEGRPAENVDFDDD